MTSVQIQAALEALEPDIFEEVVCDALAELLDTRVRRARAGEQSGRDGQSDGRYPLVVECKHYVRSKLSDKMLVGQLHQAQSAGCDLWVLAATCSVSEQTAVSLRSAAADLGLVVIILDWPEGQVRSLETLLWGARDTAYNRLGLDLGPKFVERQATLETRIERLRLELDTPLLSLEALRTALAEILETSLCDANKLRTLGTRAPAPVKDDANLWRGFVRRRQVEASLQHWITTPSLINPAILLGEEGVGKSLAALHWLRERANFGDLVFIVSGGFPIGTDDPFEILSGLAAKHYGNTIDRWRKRLLAFLSTAAFREMQIIIYLDGINEQPEAPWLGLVKALQSAPFSANTRVLMSCRPWPYEYRFQGISRIDHPPVKIAVDLFNDQELDEVLALHGRRLGEFPGEMHDLLSRPRLLSMALRNEKALRTAGEYTPTRLFWEDWVDRLEARRNIINENQYRKALVTLAQGLDRSRVKVSPAVTTSHNQLSDALLTTQFVVPQTEALEHTFSEIVDGGLARLDQDLTLNLDETFAALALGLELRTILLDQNRNPSSSHLGLKDLSSQILEPWGGADFGAAVARFSCWACVELPTPLPVRSALLAVWMEEQNYAAAHAMDALAIVARDEEAAFEAAEDLWLAEPGKGALALQRAFERALNPNHKAGQPRSAMIARVRKWAGWAGLDRQASPMLTIPFSEQRQSAFERFLRSGGMDVGKDEDFDLAGERLRIRSFQSGDGAATFGLDALVAASSADLAPIVRTAAVSGVIDLPEDLTMCCVRMLRRVDTPDLVLIHRLQEILAEFKRKGTEIDLEAADNLAFMMDLQRAASDTLHPQVETFWPGAAPIFRARFETEDLARRLDPHVLREALLEPDASLDSEILQAIKAMEGGELQGTKPVNFNPILDAARCRGLLPFEVGSPVYPLGETAFSPSRSRAVDVKLVVGVLTQAVVASSAEDRYDALTSLAAMQPWQDGPTAPKLVAEETRILENGISNILKRDNRSIDGRWLSEVLRTKAKAIANLIQELKAAKAFLIDQHLATSPGVLMGLIQAGLLLKIPSALDFWYSLPSLWQEFLLPDDRRYWYFDLPFEAADSPDISIARNFVLAAADSEDRLLDIVLSARRWGREAWLQDAIQSDLDSCVPWRTCRALVMTGMFGADPSGLSIKDPQLAPDWIAEASLAGFRYARREARMLHWIEVATAGSNTDKADCAVNILLADGDRRLSYLNGRGSKNVWLRHVEMMIAGRDSHRPDGGMMEFFLGIHGHPWLGPPGLPHTPFA